MNKHTKNVLSCFVLLTLVLASCTNKSKLVNDKQGNQFQTNKVDESQKGLNDSSLSYAIFFPETGKEKQQPVLFLLDPHANGSLPLNKYKNLANKYGYVLVGSNISRNGLAPEIVQKHIRALVNEIKTRYSIDKSRMFIGGFSGGAKLAVMYANKMPSLIGVVACGGSLPMSFNKAPNFYYAGIVGDKDFNYLEMRQTFAIFDQYGFDYTAEVFSGKHEWPPVNSFEKAFIGFDIYSAKLKRKQLSKKMLEELKTELMNNSKALAQQNKTLDQYEELQQAKRWLYGLTSVTDIQKQIAQLTRNKVFAKQLKQRQLLVQHEVHLRQEFIKAIEHRELEWWQTEINKITSSPANNTESYLVKQRLLNYISMASFMLIKNDLNDVNLDSAIDKIKIYELVDPNNFDVYLMYAKYYMLSEDFSEMKQAYSKALELGFKPNESYKNDAFWTGLIMAN